MRIDYEKQQSANLLSFFVDKEMEHKRNVLNRIIKAMKENNVVWALSCLAMYCFKGLIDDFNLRLTNNQNKIKKFFIPS